MLDKLDLMRDYSDGKIASIVTNKLPQLEFKEPEKTRITEEKKPTSNVEENPTINVTRSVEENPTVNVTRNVEEKLTSNKRSPQIAQASGDLLSGRNRGRCLSMQNDILRYRIESKRILA